jgi:transposase
LRGTRVHAAAPAGHWHTTTIIGSIRLDGTSACMSIEGSTDTPAFNAYVGRVLVPTLRPGDFVVLDNLSSHKSPETVRLIESAGARVLFLPPYSPDLNPIEKMWSKLKQLLRSAEARTLPELDAAVAEALRFLTPSDARGWFASCGYSII